MNWAMGHKNISIKAYVLEEITIKLSGALRMAGVSGDMKREIEGSVYWPVTHSIRWIDGIVVPNVNPIE